MKKERFSLEKDGFSGIYTPCPEKSSHAVIALMGLSAENALMRGFVTFLSHQGLNVLAMAPISTGGGMLHYPLERFVLALDALKARGNERFAITGASATGMTALSAAARIPDFTLTMAMTPCDFVMEGYLRGRKDGTMERPGDFESALTWKGKELPFLPYAYRHPQYWQKMQEESRLTHNKMAARNIFDVSEKMCDIPEDAFIPVENIRGRLLLFGAQDDALWDTCRYISRMEKRLKTRGASSEFSVHTYVYGTHFVFPQGMVRAILPAGDRAVLGFFFQSAKAHPEECRNTRMDVEKQMKNAIRTWKQA